jgi:hypothetical protein
MAQVVAFVPDLLFGSTVQAAVTGAGHSCRLVSTLTDADLETADAVILDLTADAPARLGAARAAIDRRLPTLAFYSHVEADVRQAASRAGVSIVVPRSRMAREGTALVARLIEEGREATASGPS